MKKKLLLAGGLLAVIGVTAGTTALATGTGPTHAREAQGAQALLTPVTGSKKGFGCRLGFFSETATLTPPDDSTSNNPPAASITMAKECKGVVIGRFSSEVTTGASGFVHIDMRATCVGTGGFATHCTVGEMHFASPGHSFFQASPNHPAEVNSITMYWRGLARGRWTFEVLPGGDGTTGNLQFRTFTVET